MSQDQHHAQRQYMTYQGISSDTYSRDDSFFSAFSIEELQESHTRIICLQDQLDHITKDYWPDRTFNCS